MKKFVKDNGLSLVLGLIFALCLAGHFFCGRMVYNEELKEHGLAEIGAAEYARSGHFLESVFENWESEFLQMAVYVLFTVFLVQRGSAESKKPDEKELVDEDPAGHRNDPDAPGPVRSGGWALKIYNHSLTIALLALFAVSFAFHAVWGLVNKNAEQKLHGLPQVSMLAYMSGDHFWFESFQNWQSEFLSVAAIVVLSIYLRQRGSPESKPVHFAHSKTGRE